MIRCKQCQFENEDAANFCERCSFPLRSLVPPGLMELTGLHPKPKGPQEDETQRDMNRKGEEMAWLDGKGPQQVKAVPQQVKAVPQQVKAVPQPPAPGLQPPAPGLQPVKAAPQAPVKMVPQPVRAVPQQAGALRHLPIVEPGPDDLVDLLEEEHEGDDDTTIVAEIRKPSMTVTAISLHGQVLGRYAVDRDGVIVGRDVGAIRHPEDPWLSPWHASITYRDARLEVVDLDSTNGTYFRIKEPHILIDGQQFIVGNQIFHFRSTWGVEEKQGGTSHMGSQMSLSPERLVHMGPNGSSVAVHFLRNPISIGRDKGEIRLPWDRTLSAVHVRVEPRPGAWYLVDLGSERGAFVKVDKRIVVQSGDQVRMGMLLLSVE